MLALPEVVKETSNFGCTMNWPHRFAMQFISEDIVSTAIFESQSRLRRCNISEAGLEACRSACMPHGGSLRLFGTYQVLILREPDVNAHPLRLARKMHLHEASLRAVASGFGRRNDHKQGL